MSPLRSRATRLSVRHTGAGLVLRAVLDAEASGPGHRVRPDGDIWSVLPRAVSSSLAECFTSVWERRTPSVGGESGRVWPTLCNDRPLHCTHQGCLPTPADCPSGDAPFPLPDSACGSHPASMQRVPCHGCPITESAPPPQRTAPFTGPKAGFGNLGVLGHWRGAACGSQRSTQHLYT